MNTVMKRTVIIEAVQLFRAQHDEEYKLAMEEFRLQFSAGLRDFADQVEAGGGIEHPIMGLVIPRSWDKEYAKAIEGLKRDTRESIELSNQDFDMLVLNEWPFSKAVEENNRVLAKQAVARQTKH